MRLTVLAFPIDIKTAVQSNEIRLAAISIPEGADSVTAANLRMSIDQAFVFGFRLIMLICAGLSVASSGFALQMIGAPKSHRSS